MTMIDKLKQDCEDWISSLTEVMRNEREMQVRLAVYLKETRHYDNVHVEYPLPLQVLKKFYPNVGKQNEFPWKNDIYIDIVVEKDGQFAAVELKYATRAISQQPEVFCMNLKAFAQNFNLKNQIKVIKNQEASNLTMYNYWKDVHRIEALTHIPKVIGGVAIILTNNKLYWEQPRQTPASPAYSEFSTHHDREVIPGLLEWGTNKGEKISDYILKTHPNFSIDGSYKCHWDDTKITVKDAQGESLEKKSPDWFRYMITEVKASKGRNND